MSPAAVHLAILQTASLLVRENQRAEWLAEWRSELWHAAHEPGMSRTAFCLGSFKDAFWLRRNGPLPRSYGVLHLDVPAPPAAPDTFPDRAALLSSPVQCLSFLAVTAALAIAIAFLLPASRQFILPSPYPDARNLVMLTGPYYGYEERADRANAILDSYPSVSVEQFRSLKNRPDGPFTGLAFYLPTHVRAGQSTLNIARTSAGLFRLLNIPFPPADDHTASLVLTRAAWRKYFNGDPRIVGRHVQVAGQPALVSRILSPDQWTLPDHLDGWLIESESALAAEPAFAYGYALAHLPHAAPTGNIGPEPFNYISLSARSRWPLLEGPLFEFVFGCLLVPITTSLASLGDYPRRMPRRWMFLAAKFALLLSIVIFGALDLASIGSFVLEPVVLFVAFFGGSFAMRWTLADQRRRCPVCLRHLANPVRIGQSSRMLLEWHGTELMCLQGHGLLHIPERPSIWFSAQRWMDLGPSWSGLFP